MGAYLVRRLITVVPLVVGVVAVVFLVFDSGLLGDPSMALAGRHADTAMIARYDRELGLVEDWREDAVRLTLHAPPGAATGIGRLTFHEDRLTIELPDRTSVLALDSGNLRDVVDGVQAGHAPGQWSVTAEIADDAHEAGLSLAGLGAAQRTGSARLMPGTPLSLAWARPVPALRRFLGDLRALATFNFGESLRTRQPITHQIALRAGPSLGLAIPAFTLTTLLSLALALACARRRSGPLDRTVLVACTAGMSVTVLAFILLGQKWLAYDLGLFPVYGFSGASYLALPILIWVAAALGPEVRLYRTLLIDAAGGGHVTAARTRGLSAAAAYRGHVLRGALVPIVTHLVGALPFLFMGSLLLERFFGIPGLGDYIIEAVFAGDPPVLKAMTFLVALGFIAAHVLGDLLCALADPRLRLS